MNILPLIDVIIHTKNREDSLRTCVNSILEQSFQEYRLIIYDDASDNYNFKETFKDEFADPRIKLISGIKPLGLIPARNHTIKLATAEILLCLDDDTTLIDNDFIKKINCHFERHTDHALVAPKILDINNNHLRTVVPFSRKQKKSNGSILEQKGLVSYYKGGAYALRRRVLTEVGYISLHTSYGEDELDISYKLIRSNYSIYYRPDLVVLHHGTKFRKNRKLNIGTHMENRIYLAYQYLPLPYCLSFVIIWFIYYNLIAITKKTSGIISLYRSFFFAISKGRKNYTRKPLNKHAISYLKEHHGRLWY